MSGGEKLFLSLNYVGGQYIDEGLKKMGCAHSAPSLRRNGARTLAAVAVIAALLAALGAGAYALGLLFNRGTRDALEANATQQQELVENGMATVFDTVDDSISVTVEGVTMMPLEVVADANMAIVTFAVDGFALNAGEEPGFETVISEGDNSMSFSGGFAYAQSTDSSGDLTGVPEYADENGRLEFTLTLWPSSEGYSLLGKTARVRFVNLGIACKVSTTPVVFGEWVFEIELPSESGARECFLNKPVGDTGFTVNKATISQLSVYIGYSAPTDAQIKGDELGIPMLEGVILKDGTRLENIFGSGGEGYSDDVPGTAYSKSGLTQVIDPNEVSALLFYRSGGDKQTAIEVPLF